MIVGLDPSALSRMVGQEQHCPSLKHQVEKCRLQHELEKEWQHFQNRILTAVQQSWNQHVLSSVSTRTKAGRLVVRAGRSSTRWR